MRPAVIPVVFARDLEKEQVFYGSRSQEERPTGTNR